MKKIVIENENEKKHRYPKVCHPRARSSPGCRFVWSSGERKRGRGKRNERGVNQGEWRMEIEKKEKVVGTMASRRVIDREETVDGKISIG